MARIGTLLLVGALALAAAAALALGCAGTTPNGPSGPSMPSATGTGTAVVSITWPERPEVVAEMIPVATESITLKLYDGETEITGLPGMESLPFNRPEGSDPLGSRSVTISNVPAKPVRFVAEAHCQQNGEGSRLALGEATVTIKLEPEHTQVAVVLDKIPPPPPANLTATVESSTIRLGWAEPDETCRVTGYNVYRTTTSGVYGALYAQVPKGSPSYVDVSVTPGTTYYYVVKSYDLDAWESDSTDEASGAVVAEERIYFTYGVDPPEYGWQIWSVRPDGTNPAVAAPTTEGFNWNQDVSLVSGLLAWSYTTTPPGGLELYVGSTAPGSPAEHVTLPDGSHLGGAHPSWAPDGRRLVMDCAGQLVVYGTSAHTVTPLGVSGSHPDWSADGQWIAYSGLSVASAAGVPIPAPSLPGGEHPSWHPRDPVLAYDTADEREVWIADVFVDAQGTWTYANAHKVADGLTPDWSPDGDRLVWATPGETDLEVARYDHDSRSLVAESCITDSIDGPCTYPAW